MKKLLILMLVLGLASSANAVIITFNSPSGPLCPHPEGQPPPSIDVLPGAFVVVEITSDTAITAGYMVSITESTTSAAGHSTTAAVGTLNAGFDDAALNNTGILQNKMTNFGAGTPRHMIIDRIVGGVISGGSVAVGQVLYQFELKIPDLAVYCETFTINAAVGFPVISPPPAGYSHSADGTSVAGSNALIIHVIPEPATIALLGLGGLLLRRRK